MSVNHPPRGNELDRDELNALRRVSKGMLLETITADHRSKLRSLGYIHEAAGVITITTSGKAMIGK